MQSDNNLIIQHREEEEEDLKEDDEFDKINQAKIVKDAENGNLIYKPSLR